MSWEVKNLCNLLNVIFSDAVGHEVDKLRKEKCCGCEVNHPSQRRHECLIMVAENCHFVFKNLFLIFFLKFEIFIK